MKDSLLLKIALIWTVLGIFILFFVSTYFEPEEVIISDLSLHVNKAVYVKGTISEVSYKETVSFIDLEDDSGKIDVVLFELPKQSLKTGDFIKVKGKVTIYKGNLEIIAQEILCLNCNGNI